MVQVCTSLSFTVATGMFPPGSYPLHLTNPALVGCEAQQSFTLVVAPPPTLTAVALQKEYELDDPAATGITDVLLDGDNDYSTGLAYDAYMEDGRWFFRLRQLPTANSQLIVQYTVPHTVCGLDGSLDSTLSDDLNTALIDGACYYCCLSRAAAGVEANNIEAQVALNWMKIAHLWLDVFRNALHDAIRWPAARGEPGQALAWNDPQHDPEYP